MILIKELILAGYFRLGLESTVVGRLIKRCLYQFEEHFRLSYLTFDALNQWHQSEIFVNGLGS